MSWLGLSYAPNRLEGFLTSTTSIGVRFSATARGDRWRYARSDAAPLFAAPDIRAANREHGLIIARDVGTSARARDRGGELGDEGVSPWRRGQD